ncbi:MAG: 50S ribosomal protein L10 [Patescibacteria group bacterium]
MAKSKSQKNQEVDALTSGLQSAKAAVVITMTGLKVKDNWDFRKILRKEGVKLEVAKKTLFKIALDKANIELPVDDLTGTVAMLLDDKEEARAAKLAADFKKDHPQVELQKGTVRMGGKWQSFNQAEILVLSKLPSRQELISKLMYLLNYPTTGLVRVLAGVPQKFVGTIKAIQDKKAQS